MIYVNFDEWPNWRFGNKVLLLNNLIQISHYYKQPYKFNNFFGLDLFDNLIPEETNQLKWDDVLTPEFFLKNKKTDIKLLSDKIYKLDMTLFETFYDYDELSTFEIFKLKIPNIEKKYTLIGVHFRGTDFASWDSKAILPISYYLESLNFLKTTINDSFKVYLATDDPTLPSYHATIEWLQKNNIDHNKGNLTDWKKDFYALSQSDYVISTPSTFCITSSLCGRNNKKIIHHKQWVEDYKLNSNYFRDIFWKKLYNTQTHKNYSLYKLI